MPLAVEKPLTTGSCGLSRGRPAWNVFLSVASSKTGSYEPFTGRPETATGTKVRFSGRGRVCRCAVRATSLPCPGVHPGTRPIGWCRRNVGPSPLLSDSTQASTSARSYRRYLPSSTHGIAPDRVCSRTQPTGTDSSSATSFASSRRSLTPLPPYASRREDVRRTARSARRKNHRHRSTPAPDLIIRVPHRAARLERRRGRRYGRPRLGLEAAVVQQSRAGWHSVGSSLPRATFLPTGAVV